MCGTGWVPSLQFFSEEQCAELGLPHLPNDSKEDLRWTELGAEANKKVLSTFPELASPPPHYLKHAVKTPYRLYRNLVPISESGSKDAGDRSIAFIGHIGVGNYFLTVEAQVMWAMVYLDGKLVLPEKGEQERDVATFVSWCRKRYLSSGLEGNNMTFELLGFVDTLLADLRLASHKRKGWFKSWFGTVWARNLKGLKEELVERWGYGESAE